MLLRSGVEFPIVLRDSGSQMTLICPKKSNNVQVHNSIDTTSIVKNLETFPNHGLGGSKCAPFLRFISETEKANMTLNIKLLPLLQTPIQSLIH